MLIIPPPRYLPRRRIKADAAVAAPPGMPLTLEEGTYYPDELLLVLVFDRAIDISGFVGSAVIVKDGETNFAVYTGAGSASQPDPTEISISLVLGPEYDPGDVMLFATALTGIKAVDDGGLWAGASDVELPFG